MPLELLLLAIGVFLMLTFAAGTWGWREVVRQVSMGLALSFVGSAPLVALLAALQGDPQLLLAAGGLLLLALATLLVSRVLAEVRDDELPDAAQIPSELPR